MTETMHFCLLSDDPGTCRCADTEVRVGLEEVRRLLGSIGLIWAGDGYDVQVVYTLRGKTVAWRPLGRDLNNEIVEALRTHSARGM